MKNKTSGSCSGNTCSQDSCPTGDCSTCTSGPRLPPGILSKYDIDAPTADGILIWAEIDGDRIERSVHGLIGKAASLDAGRVFAVIFGDADRRSLCGELFEYGVDTVYHIRNTDLNGFRKDHFTTAMNEVSERVNPIAVFISGTLNGRALASSMAVKTNAEYVTDCTDVTVTAGEISISGTFGGPRNVTMDPRPVLSFIPGSFGTPGKQVGRKGTIMNRPFKTA